MYKGTKSIVQSTADQATYFGLNIALEVMDKIRCLASYDALRTNKQRVFLPPIYGYFRILIVRFHNKNQIWAKY